MKNRIIFFLLFFLGCVRIQAQYFIPTFSEQYIGAAAASYSDAISPSNPILVSSIGEPIIGLAITVGISHVNLIQGYIRPEIVYGTYSICAGDSVTIPSPLVHGDWNTNPGLTHITLSGAGLVTGINSGTEIITFFSNSGPYVEAGIYTITVKAAPTATITGTTNLCHGSEATMVLTGTPYASVLCSDGGTATLNGTGTGVHVTTSPPASSTTYTITSVSLGGCTGIGSGSDMVTVVNPLSTPTVTGATSVCTGTTATYSATGTGGAWSTVSVSIATVSATGVVRGLATGVNTVVYTNTNACNTVSGQKVFTVYVTPAPTTITGPSSLCTLASGTLTASVAGGTWSSHSTGIASITAAGVVTGETVGTDIISYTLPTDVCGTAVTSTVTLTVNSTPSAGTLSGATSVCTGGTATVTATVGGGAWSMSNGDATISGGVITGVSGGTDNVIYSISSSCGTASVTRAITVTGSPTVGTIAFPSTMCVGGSASISCLPAGGTWSVSSSAILAIGAPCHAYAVGVATVFYTVVNTCHSSVSPLVVTVITTPTVSAIAGNSPLCTSGTLNLTDGASGGTWLSNNPAVATVSGGVVSPVTTGTAVIVYSVTNACGSSSVATTVTVTPTPVAATISGTNTLCTSGTASLTASLTGGTWASGATGIVTVSATGVIRGMTSGTGLISYTMPGNTCGSAQTATISVTVMGAPSAGTITGIPSICNGASSLFTESVSGGTWSSSNTLVASVNGSGSVTAVGIGSAVIIYSVTNACGSASVATTVTVTATPVAATISGTSTLCTSGTATLTASLTGGTWTSGASGIVTVSATGVVHGMTAGTGLISYTMPGSTCGSAQTTTVSVTVIGVPSAGTITGIPSICNGTSTLFTESVSGGTWSSSNTSVASINGSGSVTTVAGGAASIIYSVTGTCGSSSASYSISVIQTPTVATISGATKICLSGNATLTASEASGTWVSALGVATVSSAGVVRGVTLGTDVISYTLPATSCSPSLTTTYAVSVVNSYPGGFTGATSVCQGAATIYTVTGAGDAGIWTTANGNTSVTATSLTTGMVTGLAAGTSTVVFTVSNVCGTNSISKAITVKPLPTVAPISIGATTLCKGATTPISDATLGGHWTVSDPTILLLGSPLRAGSVAGIAFLNYAITNTCGVITTSVAVTVTSCPGAARDIEEGVTTENNNTNVIKVFPNPSTGMLFIEATMKVDAKLSSIDGRLLIDQKDVTEMNMNILANGIYFINVYDNATGLLLKTDRIVKAGN